MEATGLVVVRGMRKHPGAAVRGSITRRLRRELQNFSNQALGLGLHLLTGAGAGRTLSA